MPRASTASERDPSRGYSIMKDYFDNHPLRAIGRPDRNVFA
jgi:hypothetical protein